MKTRLLLFLLLAALTASHAAVIYSGVQNVPIPLDFNGEYLRIDTGTTTAADPFATNWATAPWLNPFFGGVDIANSPLLRPVIAGSSQILNLAVGTTVSSSSNFVSGESGSSTHFGTGSGQFALNTPGYMGVTFQTTTGGPAYYGWVELQVSNVGPGEIISWAYNNVSGAPINVGDIGPVPEPCTVVFGVACAGFALAVRRRR